MYRSTHVDIAAVERVWLGDSDVDPAIGHRSEPVLGMDLVFSFLEGKAEIALQGPLTTRRTYPHRPGARYLGVRFRAGYGAMFEDLKPAALRDSASRVDRLWKVDLTAVAEQLHAALAASPGRVPAEVVHGALGRPLRLAQVESPHLERALDQLRATGGGIRIGELARDLAISTRQLERLFERHVGVSPKLLARLLRVERVMSSCRGARASLAAIAIETGYTDQAHMTREVRRTLGTTPAAARVEAQHYKNLSSPAK